MDDDPLRVTWLPLPCAVGALAAQSRSPYTGNAGDPNVADVGHHPTLAVRFERGGFIQPRDLPTSAERDLAKRVKIGRLGLPLGSRAFAYVSVPLSAGRVAKPNGDLPDGLLVLWHGKGYAIAAPVVDWTASTAWPWPSVANYYVGQVLAQSRELAVKIAALA